MITDGKPFDTNFLFSGGAGMFLQYHDIVKPVYLYTIFKMILMDINFGLPINILKQLSVHGLIEWYIKRRYRNPLKCLDYNNIVDDKDLDDALQNLLQTDESIYRMSPGLNIQLMLKGYNKHKMIFPVFIYSEREEPYILQDCKKILPGVAIKYVHGDLKSAIEKCDENFTYIFSDVELLKSASEILIGTCSHLLIAEEYRYNYKDNCKTFKYNLSQIEDTHKYLRIETTYAMNLNNLVESFGKILLDGGY